MHHTATHCDALQHTATHCITLQHTCAIFCEHIQQNVLSRARHCNTLQHTAPHCTTLQHTCAIFCERLQHLNVLFRALGHLTQQYVAACRHGLPVARQCAACTRCIFAGLVVVVDNQHLGLFVCACVCVCVCVVCVCVVCVCLESVRVVGVRACVCVRCMRARARKSMSNACSQVPYFALNSAERKHKAPCRKRDKSYFMIDQKNLHSTVQSCRIAACFELCAAEAGRECIRGVYSNRELPYLNNPHYSGPIQWARDNCALKCSIAARPGKQVKNLLTM